MCVLALGLLSLTSLAVSADGFRCGHRLVSVGDSMVAVRAVCADPRAVYGVGTVEHGVARIRELGEPQNPARDTLAAMRRRILPVVRWEYSLGPGQFLRILSFEGDLLTATELGPRQ